MHRITRIGLMTVAIVLIAACGTSASQAPDSAAPSEPTTGGTTFTIENNTLPDASAKAGEQISWRNLDSVAHTVTTDDGSVNGSVSAGSTFSQTFRTAGTFPYHCNIHPTMTATITITE